MRAKEIHQYTLEGQFIRTYYSVTDAQLTITKSCGKQLNAVANKRYGAKSYMGFLWSFIRSKEEGVKLREVYLRSNNFGHKRKVFQYSLDGKFLADYNSYKQAAKVLNLPENGNGIGSCARGEFKTYHGFKWSHNKIEADPASPDTAFSQN